MCEQCRAGGQPIGRSTATLARSSGSEAAAATVIQAHFRGFSVRDLLVPSTFDMHELKQVRPNPNHNANPNPTLTLTLTLTLTVVH